MVPSASTISSRLMPMPLSSTVRRRLSASMCQADARLGVFAEQLGIGDRLVAQPLAGVRRVGNQFTQKDVLVGIDRVHHQVQKLGDIGLEGVILRAGLVRGGHCRKHPSLSLNRQEMASAPGEVKIGGLFGF